MLHRDIRVRTGPFAFALVLATAACAPRVDLDAERAAIYAADSAWLAAAKTNNIDSVLTFWTDDARVIAPGQPPVVGRAAIREMLTQTAKMPGFSVSWQTNDVIVAPSGDVAWSLGPNVFTVPGRNGAIDTLRNQATVLWRKGADGRWRSAIDTWTPQ